MVTGFNNTPGKTVTFGPTTTTTGGFGIPSSTTATPGFSFGTGGASTSGTSGFGAAGGFGSTSSGPNLNFGSGFGASSTPQNLGVARPTNFSGVSTAVNFGATPAAPSSGFSFGATTTAPTMGFGTASTAAPALGFTGFGARTTAPSLGFGATISSTSAAPSLGGFSKIGGFSAASSTTPSLGLGTGFGTTTTTTVMGFGSGFGTASTGVGLTTGFGTTTTAPTLGLSAGFATASTATPSSLGGLGVSNLGSSFGGGQTLNISFGAGGTTLGGLGSTSVGTTGGGTASKGLGGIDINKQVTTTVASSTGKPENKALKDTALPKEMLETVEELKKYVKSQKEVKEQIARMSSRPLYKVEEDLLGLNRILGVVASGLQQNAAAVEKLKQNTAQELRNAEIAQRTKDTPPGLQYDNTAPAEYFQRLVQQFENRMQNYRQQIQLMEHHLTLLSESSAITPQELLQVIHRIHDSFVGLAAHLYAVHETVKVQKEHYLNYRRVVHNDLVDVFRARKLKEEQRRTASILEPPVGPTPFTEMPSAAAVAMATAINRSQQPSQGGFLTSGHLGQSALGGSSVGFGTSSLKPMGFGSAFSSTVNQSSGFGNTSLGDATPLNLTTNQPFTLQKPPTGGKRNKR